MTPPPSADDTGVDDDGDCDDDDDGGGGFAAIVAAVALTAAAVAAVVTAVGDGSPPVRSLTVVIRWNRGQERRAAPSPRSPVTVPIASVGGESEKEKGISEFLVERRTNSSATNASPPQEQESFTVDQTDQNRQTRRTDTARKNKTGLEGQLFFDCQTFAAYRVGCAPSAAVAEVAKCKCPPTPSQTHTHTLLLRIKNTVNRLKQLGMCSKQGEGLFALR